MKKFHLAFCEEWRLVSQVRINERCAHARGGETRRDETSDSLYPILSCRSFHAWDTKKVVPLAAPDAWIFSTLWRVITQSSRSIIPRPSCEFYMKKNLPLSFCALRSHFLFLPSFLSFFFLHLLSSFYHSLRKRRKNGDVFHKKGTRVKKKKKKR